MGNQAGGRSTSRKHNDWWYFDRLPPQLRQELTKLSQSYDPKWFYDRWNGGKHSIPSLIRAAKSADLEAAKKPVKWRVGFKWQSVPSATKATGVRPLYK
jgi:hypothetical protein